jgi:hypothetical protein
MSKVVQQDFEISNTLHVGKEGKEFSLSAS